MGEGQRALLEGKALEELGGIPAAQDFVRDRLALGGGRHVTVDQHAGRVIGNTADRPPT